MEDELYARLVEGVRKPIKHKIALISCGASGAGKTTSRVQFIKDAGLTTTFVYLNMDNYWKYAPTQTDARALYRRLVTRVVQDGYSFLFDATCRNTSDIFSFLTELKEKGYIVKLSITYAKLGTVLQRLRKRVQQYTRPEVGLAIYKEVEQKIERLMNNPSLDEIFLYDNETTTRLIYHKSVKKMSCLFPDSAFYFDVSKYC
jgi:predicted ABC-type ATPase